jgi:hypothetical protein
MMLEGQAIIGSSSAPTRTTMKRAPSPSSQKSGVPQVVQKRRRMIVPLSDLLLYSPGCPVSRRPAVSKIVLMDALPEERYWQTLHQQARVKIGERSNTNRMAPHKHLPVIVPVTDLPH